ncbi:MAG: hypothetical protein LBH06_07785, partial [Rikenellaceae bacterium]|nr:hypothetical protein [Rikenellaceae bacterium]
MVGNFRILDNDYKKAIASAKNMIYLMILKISLNRLRENTTHNQGIAGASPDVSTSWQMTSCRDAARYRFRGIYM